MAQVNEQSAAVARMAGDWAVIDALLGGTPAMRAAGKTYLPQQPREADDSYAYRLKVATLYPAFERTVGVMAGKPFSKQLTVGEGVPERIKELIPNIDNQQTSLHVFAAKTFTELMSYGYCGILVDYTKTEGAARTQADEQAIGARPYWVLYKHGSILGMDWEETQSGWKLERVRLLETITEKDGAYGKKEIQQVRVLEPGIWQIHRQPANGGDWEIVDEGTTTLNYIPFVPLLADAKNLEEGIPPLRNLAYLNIEHWQLKSDLRKSLRFAIVPIVWTSGLTATTEITVSADSILNLPVQGARLEVAQGQAEAVRVGREEVVALEKEMIQTGAELLVATESGKRTATEDNNEKEANKSLLQRRAEEAEDGLDIALQYTADWLGLPEGGTVTLFSDYGAGSLSDASATLVKELGQIGLITPERVVQEMQRRGVLESNFDAVEEVALAREQAQPLGIRGADETVQP